MKKRTRNILIGSGIAAVGAAGLGAAYRRSSKYLMKLAFDREEPKNASKDKEKMIPSEEMAAALAEIADAAEKFKNVETETVEIESSDGIRLVGHFYANENPKRVIVAMHGWRSSWLQDFGTIAPFWHENGCSVLYAEQRGQGDSGGEYMSFGLLERYDCLEWAKWADERTEGKLPIYLAGVSMGATTVLMAGGLDLPESVHGIAADCAFTSPNAIWKHVLESNLHLPYGVYGPVANELCKKKIQVSADYSTTEALKNCKVPVMFVHGTDDRFVPVEMTYENYKACVSPKRLFVVPGADHGMSYFVDREGYEKEVKKFWEDYDRAAD